MLLPDYLALALGILLGVLLSLGVLHRLRWVNTVSYTMASVIFAVHVFHARLEFLWAVCIPHPAVVVFKMVAGWCAGIAILLGLAARLPKPSDRRALKLITVLVGLLGAWIFLNQLVDPGVRDETCWFEETMLQTTANTCMAAATCTYLRTIGVSAHERDAVQRGLISRYGGSETHAWRVLKLSLPPEHYRVCIRRLARDEMAGSGHWYVGAIDFAMLMGHGIAFRVEPGGENVTVRDPVLGQRDLSWAQFSKVWWGVGVWAEPIEPEPPAGEGTNADAV